MFNVILLSLLLLKSAAQAQVQKTKFVYKLLLQHHKHLCHGKMKKTQIKEVTNG